jgi:hypothetical protein
MAIAETTAATIRQRYTTFRAALQGLEEYGVELPPATGNANTFYLPLFLDRLLERTGLQADEFATLCHERYKLEVVPGTRMYPPAGLPQGSLTLPDGQARIRVPGPVVYAPDFATTQRPFLRVSFGIEHRIPEAAARLRQACVETFRR